MTALQRLVSIAPDLAKQEEWIRLFYEDIWTVGEILFSEKKTKKERKRLLRKLRDDWEDELARLEQAPDAAATSFLAECCRITDEQWEGLFHCYSNPRIPATNNGTEQLILYLKSQERIQARSPNPGARFIRNAPIKALFVNRRKVSSESFIASRSQDQMNEARRQLKTVSRTTGVARLARSDLPRLLDRVTKRWRRPRDGKLPNAAEERSQLPHS